MIDCILCILCSAFCLVGIIFHPRPCAGYPYCYSSISFSYRYYWVFFLLTRFLKNGYEILRDGAYLPGMAENDFSSDNITSGPIYWRFSDLEGVVMFRDLLWNDSRYLLQIFTEKGLKFLPFESQVSSSKSAEER